jgi:hypothetical protein
MRAGIASRYVVNQMPCQGELNDLAANREFVENAESNKKDLARKTYASGRSYTETLRWNLLVWRLSNKQREREALSDSP